MDLIDTFLKAQMLAFVVFVVEERAVHWLTIHALCKLLFIFGYFSWFCGLYFGSDCISSWPLLFFLPASVKSIVLCFMFSMFNN